MLQRLLIEIVPRIDDEGQKALRQFVGRLAMAAKWRRSLGHRELEDLSETAMIIMSPFPISSNAMQADPTEDTLFMCPWPQAFLLATSSPKAVLAWSIVPLLQWKIRDSLQGHGSLLAPFWAVCVTILIYIDTILYIYIYIIYYSSYLCIICTCISYTLYRYVCL